MDLSERHDASQSSQCFNKKLEKELALEGTLHEYTSSE